MIDNNNARKLATDRVKSFTTEDLIDLALDRLDTMPPEPIENWSEDFLINFAVDCLTEDYINSSDSEKSGIISE